MKPLITYGKRATGRPPLVDLSPDDIEAIRAEYLATNRSSQAGSVITAWVRFCEANPARFGHLVEHHMPTTTIPTQVMDACRKTKSLVGTSRGGAARQRHEGAYVPGTMRRHHAMSRRLHAGERASVDDATRNVACWIPWPWGGCPCSEKFGVRLGRWQTLIVHDDASSFIPFVSSVFRWHQSYRATDAASVIYRTERDVLQFDAWAIEGGVWQAKRTLAVLDGRFISAKGRPNQKLVENYIGRLWTIMAGQAGDVGRHQAEIQRNSKLYVDARAGRVDPRKHFMPLSQAQESLYSSIDYLNEKQIRSSTYGSWVPKARWEADLENAPRQTRSGHSDFLILPCAETRVVTRGAVTITEEGPLGCPMRWTFTADHLWQYNGQRVTVYFDPLAEWPVAGIATLENRREPLCEVTCISPLDVSRDRAVEQVSAIRKIMMEEVRNLHSRHTTRTLRHTGGVVVTEAGTTLETTTPQPPRDVIASPSRGTRETIASDVSDRLSRRAAALLADA